jgi:hypothetical protein
MVFTRRAAVSFLRLSERNVSLRRSGFDQLFDFAFDWSTDYSLAHAKKNW